MGPYESWENWPFSVHLMFVDDLLLFGQAYESTTKAIKKAMDLFYGISRQLISNDKTNIFSKNVNP